MGWQGGLWGGWAGWSVKGFGTVTALFSDDGHLW